MIKLILFTALLGGGYIEEVKQVNECSADELNLFINADDRKFYYCEYKDES